MSEDATGSEPTKKDINIHIGRRLRRRRRMINMSLQQLGDAVDIRFQQVQKYETAVNAISLAILYKFSNVFGVTPSYFFPGYDDKSSIDGASLRHLSFSDVNLRLQTNLRHARHMKGMSLSDLAEKIDLTFQQIQRLECGLSSTSPHRLWQLSRALDMPIDQFFIEPSKTPAVKITNAATKAVFSPVARAYKDAARKGNLGQADELVAEFTKAMKALASEKTTAALDPPKNDKM